MTNELFFIKFDILKSLDSIRDDNIANTSSAILVEEIAESGTSRVFNPYISVCGRKLPL